MSDIEKVVTRTRRLEKLLRVQYHAEGKGLHQLITSCEERLPHEVIKPLRYVATIRNKLVHEEGYKLENRRSFLNTCDECERALTPRASRFVWGVAIALVALLTLSAAAFYILYWDELIRHL